MGWTVGLGLQLGKKFADHLNGFGFVQPADTPQRSHGRDNRPAVGIGAVEFLDNHPDVTKFEKVENAATQGAEVIVGNVGRRLPPNRVPPTGLQLPSTAVEAV